MSRELIADRALDHRFTALSEWSITLSEKSRPQARGERIFDDPELIIARTGEGQYDLLLSDLVLFSVDTRRRSLQITSPPDLDHDLILHHLGNQVIPRILSKQGNLVIHAAAFAVGDQAVMLVAPSGAGKSTLAASFLGAGGEILGDDAIMFVELGGRPTIKAVYKSLRLFPDALAATQIGGAIWRPILRGATKHQVVQFNKPDDDTPRRVAGIVFLDPAPAEGIAIAPVSASEACVGLIEQSFWLDSADRDWLQAMIARAGQLVASTTAFRLSYPRDFAALPEVRRAILNVVQ